MHAAGQGCASGSAEVSGVRQVWSVEACAVPIRPPSDLAAHHAGELRGCGEETAAV
jgi:hypothetical protein